MGAPSSMSHAKRRRSLSKSLRNFFGGLRAVSAKMGKELSTDEIRALRPPALIHLPCQAAFVEDVLHVDVAQPA